MVGASMAFTLRSYQTDDLEKMYELDQACYPRGIAYSRREIRWYLMAPGADCVVAEAESVKAGTPELIGFIVAEAQAPEGHIITLDVAEALAPCMARERHC